MWISILFCINFIHVLISPMNFFSLLEKSTISCFSINRSKCFLCNATCSPYCLIYYYIFCSQFIGKLLQILQQHVGNHLVIIIAQNCYRVPYPPRANILTLHYTQKKHHYGFLIDSGQVVIKNRVRGPFIWFWWLMLSWSD